MGWRYAVLGAGMQGTAAAHDLARAGGADSVAIGDVDPARAERASSRVNRLAGGAVASGVGLDVKDGAAVRAFLEGRHAVLSAVPYFLNPAIARAAVAARASFCDLGGNTAIVQEELSLDAAAREAGVTVVPDCGLAPGLGTTLAALGIGRLDRCREVKIRCGGLPVSPRGPLGYKLVFSIEGLTNEYFGKALVLRGGRVVEVPTFEELEEIEFPPPVGRCEAFVTSGGTSTAPFTYEGRIEGYDYKTVRYPGHHAKVKTLLDLGLLDPAPVEVPGGRVSPRALFHKVATPRLDFPEDEDLVVLRVTCAGEKAGRPTEWGFDLLERFDRETGFSAMERTTAYPAAAVCAMLARGDAPRGAVPLERAIDPERFLPELLRRGIRLTETARKLLD